MCSVPTQSRILVVDDDPAALVICKTRLHFAGYEVVLASSVKQAIKQLDQWGTDSFVAVFTDYRMPVEDGLVLLRHVVEVDPSLAVIIMTAEGDKSLVMSSLRQGAHNFIEKPLTKAALVEASRKGCAATLHQRSLRADAGAARAVGSSQRFLLGRETEVRNDHLSIRYYPHEKAGGDFVATFQLDENRFVVLVTDVSGHDLNAAYHSAYLQGLARGLLQGGTELTTVFHSINRMLLEDWNGRERVVLSLAACAICVDQQAGNVTLLNCGLPNPLASDAEGGLSGEGVPGASPLGWFDELPEVTRHPLGEGFLHFWSDGLDDLAEHYGVSTLSIAHRLQDDPDSATALLEPADDDIVVGRINLCSKQSPDGCVPVLSETYSSGDMDRIDTLQAYFERSLRMAMPLMPVDRMVDTLICLREALLNAFAHGCAGDGVGIVRVQMAIDLAASSLHLRITDNGPGHDFDLEAYEPAAADELLTEHRGLIMMKNLSTDLRISERGTRIDMNIPLQTL
jgi:FixJ family two-component response regulator/anti-sigma regulatory factor (Ser/Thr protein kinase)